MLLSHLLLLCLFTSTQSCYLYIGADFLVISVSDFIRVDELLFGLDKIFESKSHNSTHSGPKTNKRLNRNDLLVRLTTNQLTSHIYIYIIYTSNLGSETALPGRGREQGRFRGSIEGARGSIKGALSEHGGVLGEQRGSRRQRRGAADGSLNWTSSISA